jgi:hypothetical protein
LKVRRRQASGELQQFAQARSRTPGSNLASITAFAVREYGDAILIRNNQNRRRRGGNNNGPRPQQMNGGNNYGNRLDNRQRGNASQLLEKYRALARDAQQAGDRVTAEYYLQYADHYYRVLGDYRDKAPDQNRARRDNFDDDSAGYNGGNDDTDSDDEDRDDDRSDARGDDRGEAPRSEDRGNDRGHWREDRPNGNRNQRDGNREPRRDAEANREPRREGEANREPRREGAGRDRQPWNGDRNRDGNRNQDAGRNQDSARSNDAPRDGDRRDRHERRPESARQPVADVIDEGPIPGLPGPATLRLNRAEATDAPERAPRAPRREAVLAEAVEPVAADPEAAAPKRRGRPRKVVDEATAE